MSLRWATREVFKEKKQECGRREATHWFLRQVQKIGILNENRRDPSSWNGESVWFVNKPPVSDKENVPPTALPQRNTFFKFKSDAFTEHQCTFSARLCSPGSCPGKPQSGPLDTEQPQWGTCWWNALLSAIEQSKIYPVSLGIKSSTLQPQDCLFNFQGQAQWGLHIEKQYFCLFFFP